MLERVPVRVGRIYARRLKTEYEKRVFLRAIRERNRKAVLLKKKKVFEQKGKLECEICGFDFEKIYGELGNQFCECHHTVPVSELGGVRSTKLSDLAIVCANCHRIIHRSRPMIAIEDLKKVVKSK